MLFAETTLIQESGIFSIPDFIPAISVLQQIKCKSSEFMKFLSLAWQMLILGHDCCDYIINFSTGSKNGGRTRLARL